MHYNRTAFMKGVRFHHATFTGDIEFGVAKIYKSADFYYAAFGKEANFSLAIFDHKCTLDLSSLIFRDSTSLNFYNTVLPDTILFSDNYNIKKEIYFTNANFTDSSRYDYKSNTSIPTYIYLLNTNIAKLHLDYLHYRLWLPDSTRKVTQFDKPKLISYDEKTSLYEQLLANFKANGQTQSYQLLDIEYQKFKWENSWAKFLPCFPELWWNFGYDKELVFKWTAYFLLFFTLITYFFIHSLNTHIYKMEKIVVQQAWRKKLSAKDFKNRLWHSFIYTSTVFFKLTFKFENLEFENRRGTFYVMMMYTAGLLCLAYMANFVIQK